jgi:TP901-1 family phage major tail protein
MATLGVVNGHYLRFYMDSVAVAYATDCTISFSAEMRELAHKDTAGDGGGWVEKAAGQKSATGSTSLLYSEETNSFATLFASFKDGEPIDVTFTTSESGDSVFAGEAFITSMEINAPNNENVTASISFEFNGEVTLS